MDNGVVSEKALATVNFRRKLTVKSVSMSIFAVHANPEEMIRSSGWIARKGVRTVYVLWQTMPSRGPFELAARAAVVSARSEPASSVEAPLEEQGISVLRSQLSAVLSRRLLTAVVAIVGSAGLQDLQNQIEYQ